MVRVALAIEGLDGALFPLAGTALTVVGVALVAQGWFPRRHWMGAVGGGDLGTNARMEVR